MMECSEYETHLTRSDVLEILGDSTTFHFDRLIAVASKDSTLCEEVGELLRIFAFGRFSDYVGRFLWFCCGYFYCTVHYKRRIVIFFGLTERRATLPPLEGSSELKLKMLTLLSLAQEKKVCSIQLIRRSMKSIITLIPPCLYTVYTFAFRRRPCMLRTSLLRSTQARLPKSKTLRYVVLMRVLFKRFLISEQD